MQKIILQLNPTKKLLNMKTFQIKYPKFISRLNGRYTKALTNKEHVFYANYENCDDNVNVEMYTRSMEFISNGAIASIGLHDALIKQDWEYISTAMAKAFREGVRNGYFEYEIEIGSVIRRK
jgi:hypothetical protein